MGAHGRTFFNLAAGATCFPMLMAFWAGALLRRPAAAGQRPDATEMTTHETQPTFKVQVERNLVLVRAVIRDSKGRALGDLRKEDFRLFDNGKAQTISHFAVEVPSSKPLARESRAQEAPDTEALPETARVPSTPQRYLAMYFDDVHMSFEDTVRTRDAADRYLAAALEPGDRVGVFTSSGQTTLDFTDDRGKLHETLFRLRPRSVVGSASKACPAIFDYQAYMIVERRDAFALAIATEETLHCQYNDDERLRANAQQDAEAEALRVLTLYQTESEYALRGVEQVARRMSTLPGQRSIVLASPGFLTVTQETRVNEIVDRALRSNVTINSLDSKGLFVALPFGDASQDAPALPRRADLAGQKGQMFLTRLNYSSDILSTLAVDTGGTFFRNSNDLDEGFRKVGALPEVYYILGFSPQNLKLDGRFHTLKVNLVNPSRLSVQARRGYYAPKKRLDASTQAKEEIEQAIFSQDELNELPIEVHTQFFKLVSGDAKLSVLTHVDLSLMRFRKEEGRNLNNLTLVTALFDRDGKYVTGKEKRLALRLRDASLERLSQSGITMQTSFDVKPGTYLVRQVVRDTEGAQLSGLNRTVEIPY